MKKAIKYYEQSLAIAREIGSRRGVGSSLGELGGVYFILGREKKAAEYYEQALTIAREVGSLEGEGIHSDNLGNVYFALGRVEEAMEYHKQSLAIYEKIGSPKAKKVRQKLERLIIMNKVPKSLIWALLYIGKFPRRLFSIILPIRVRKTIQRRADRLITRLTEMIAEEENISKDS